ncbi:MAG: hypothetical protein CSA35_02375 [Dethiosulfovibrio peptidovorans]|nr:MAG: hypothetical protein CSA35_02375 [Dethiosulfovibrio peptidovorans]
MKFVLFVEGYTEAKALPEFLKKWLDPKLRSPVGIQPVRFNGWSELLSDVTQKARMYLNGSSQNNIIAVISLLDLYGPTFYPEDKTQSDERYAWGKNKIERDVNEERFFHFFAVHEIEAWLLSQPDIFPENIKFPSKIANPEMINFNEPPAKLLDRLYQKYVKRSYKKVVNGGELFKRLDPDFAYKKCPSLQKLLDKMLSLAQNRGNA